MRFAAFFLLGITLSACAPRQTSSYQQTPLSHSMTTELLSRFELELRSRGIYLLQVTGQRIQPNSEEVLLYIVQNFKQGGAGFCPLASNGFIADSLGHSFLTIMTRDKSVRLLIYDRTSLNGLVSLTATGLTETALPSRTC